MEAREQKKFLLLFCHIRKKLLSLHQQIKILKDMKNFIVRFEAIGTNDNTLEGFFDEQTVIEDVKYLLESWYSSGLKWFVIEDEDEEIIYDSQE